MSAGNGQAPTALAITESESVPLLRVMLAELAFGYERRFNESAGEFEWRGTDPVTGQDVDWSVEAKLPNFPEDDTAASVLFKRLAEDGEFAATYTYEPHFPDKSKRHIVIVRERTGPDEMADRARAASSTFALAVCAAMVTIYGGDLAAYHKLLFPARYMESVQ